MSEAGYRTDVEDGVATLTFDRPEAGNAISSAMTVGLTQFFVDAQSNPEVRCIQVTGEGKHFSTGGDVAGFAREIEQGPGHLQREFDKRLLAAGELAKAVMGFDRPIVARVRGGVAGAGLLFVLAADMVLADDTAFFLFSHQRVGLSPDGGVSWLLPRIVGRRTAARLILTAAKVEASEALAIGLVTTILPPSDLDQETLKLVKRFVRAPQAAIKAAKTLLQASEGASAADQLSAEREHIVACVADGDFAEGVRAFMEKRPADFG